MDFITSLMVFLPTFLRDRHRFIFLEPSRSQQTNKVASTGNPRKKWNACNACSISLSNPWRKNQAHKPTGDYRTGRRAQRFGGGSMRTQPQHVLIYGPPGVGKTAAARVVLEEAKKNPLSPLSRRPSLGVGRYHRPFR